jgi:hypothetical protein
VAKWGTPKKYFKKRIKKTFEKKDCIIKMFSNAIKKEKEK